MISVLSAREASIATDHFLVLCKLRCACDEERKVTPHVRKDLAALRQPASRRHFSETFVNSYESSEGLQEDVGHVSKKVTEAITAASEQLPCEIRKPNKPWISARTILLISQRAAARASNDCELAKRLHKAVRKSAKNDRGSWLDSLVADGSWDGVRSLAKPRTHN